MTKREERFIEKLYIENVNRVRSICSEGIKIDYEIDDCTAKVFALATEKVEMLIEHKSPVGWLCVTTYNVMKEKYRYYERRNSTVSIENIADILPDKYTEVGSELEYRNLVNQIYSNLNFQEKQLVRLRLVDDKSNKEIAEILGISYSNVTSKYSRLKRKIEKLLKV